MEAINQQKLMKLPPDSPFRKLPTDQLTDSLSHEAYPSFLLHIPNKTLAIHNH